MVPRADTDAAAIGQLGDVVWVHPLDRERHQPTARLCLRGTGDAQAGDIPEALQRVSGQRALVRAHAIHADLAQVLDCRAQADGLRDRRRAGLELVWELVPGGRLEVDRGDHVAAGQKRPHSLQDLAPAVQHADPRRSERLVSGPRIEVCADRLDVDRHVRHRLGAVHQRHGARGASPRDDLRDREDRAEHVRHMSDRHHAHVAAHQF
jgi:hypothetical protein